MSAFRPLVVFRLWLGLLALLGAGPASAAAWVETSFVAHETRLTLEVPEVRSADGVVVVRHRLTVKVRGGPIQHLDVPGMPTGIELLPDAGLRRAEAGQPLLYPLEVQSTDEGTLRLRIQSERGIRGGTYVFDFGFRGSLRELLRPEFVEGMTGLTYVGPRLSSGVDAAKVVIELPRSPVPPRLWSSTDGPSVTLLEQPGKNADEFLEIALVRPHVAVLEPATWRILVDPELVPLESGETVPLEKRVSARVLEQALVRRGFDALDVWASLALGLLVGGLVLAKSLAFRGVCRRASLLARPLVPLGPGARALLAALGAGLGAYAALSHRSMATVLGALVVLALGAELWPTRPLVARGPGVWRRFEEPTESSAPSRRTAGGGLALLEYFEVRRARGALFFAFLLGVTAFSSLRVLAGSPYWSLLVWVAFGLTLPLFFTGRLSDLPKAPRELALHWRSLFLRRAKNFDLEVWLRVPVGESSSVEGVPDEARLRVRSPEPLRGVRTIEVGFEEGFGTWVKPCVVLRILAGSEAETRLGAVSWSRGREMEEKVAILRPTSARPAETLRLLQSVLARLTASSSKPSAERKSTKSEGSSASARHRKLENPVPVV